MRVSITGGTGFIGTYISRRLAEEGHELRGLVRSTSDTTVLEELGAELIVGELEDKSSLRNLVEGADCVIHNGLARALNGPEPEIANTEQNVDGSLRLLEYTRQAGCEQFVFTSTIMVYHDILQDRPLDEAHPLWPDTTYGAYKAAIEAFCVAYHHRYGMNTSVFRPAGVYGIDRPLERSAWYDLVKTVKEGGRVETAAGGKIVSVHDVAEVFLLAIGNAKVSGQIYNVVDDYLYDQRVAEIAREITGSHAVIVDRKGPGPRNHIENQKLLALGVPVRRGEAGVRSYLERLLDHMDGQGPSTGGYFSTLP